MHAVAGSAFAFGSAPTIVKVKAAKRTAGGDSPGERMFSIGVDFGTNSVRALIVRCSDGTECGSSVVDYPSGAQGVLLDPKDGLLARQNPGRLSHRPGEKPRGGAGGGGEKARFRPAERRRGRVDSTGSSPFRWTRRTVRSPDERWSANLSAQCWLWKDHTGWREAAKITEACAKIRPEYIAKCGGVYSSEWFWSKIWHCLNVGADDFRGCIFMG